MQIQWGASPFFKLHMPVLQPVVLEPLPALPTHWALHCCNHLDRFRSSLSLTRSPSSPPLQPPSASKTPCMRSGKYDFLSCFYSFFFFFLTVSKVYLGPCVATAAPSGWWVPGGAHSAGCEWALGHEVALLLCCVLLGLVFFVFIIFPDQKLLSVFGRVWSSKIWVLCKICKSSADTKNVEFNLKPILSSLPRRRRGSFYNDIKNSFP